MAYKVTPGKSINYFFQTIRGADKLSKLKDVNLAGLSDTDSLVYNLATKQWEPGTAWAGLQSGTVAPEGVKNANAGQLYTNTVTGILYFNPSASGTTWRQVIQSGPSA